MPVQHVWRRCERKQLAGGGAAAVNHNLKPDAAVEKLNVSEGGWLSSGRRRGG